MQAVRKTNINDAVQIQALIRSGAKTQEVLPRSLNDIYENIRDFFVQPQGKKIVACCALHLCWYDLAEIRSLVVNPKYRNTGIGSHLVRACLDEAKSLKISKVFLLTMQPDFFKKFGFKKIKKSQLPHKIWNDCTSCVKFPECNEIAMMRKF